MIEAHDVHINLPAPPPPPRTSWVWKFAALALGLGFLLELAAISNELHSLVRVESVRAMVEIEMFASDDLEDSGQRRANGLRLTPSADTQVLHENKITGAPVVTLQGKGDDAADFRYVIVQGKGDAWAVVIDRETGGVWQCIGTVSNYTVNEKHLGLDCAQVYDGPIQAPKGKGK